VTAAAPRAPAGARPLPALAEAAMAAGVALALALPLIGLHVVDLSGTIIVETRWSWVAIGVGAVFLGRLALIAGRGLLARRGKKTPAGAAASRWRRGAWVYWLAWAVAIFALALPFLPFASARIVDLGITLLIYIMLGWGLNVVVGLAGLLDLGYVAFYAVGAYSYALLARHFGWSFWLCLPLAGVFAASFGVLLGFPVLRLRGDYLAIVTLGFGEMVRIVLNNWTSFTGGPDGLLHIPQPTFFGIEFAEQAEPGHTTFHQLFGLPYDDFQQLSFLYYLILVLALVTNAFTLRLRRLPIGRAWEALREDEVACRSLGINPTTTKLSAFAIGAMLAGFAGSFFATRQTFISPESFVFIESAIILSIVVLGGMGSQFGVVAAAAILILLPEFGRALQDFRMLCFGAAMVLIMVWRPQGLMAHRAPSLLLGAMPARGGGEA